MPQMPSRIAKGPILMHIEQKMNDTGKPPGTMANQLRNALNNQAQTLDQAFSTVFGVPPNHPYTMHLDNHWFDETGGWWPGQQPIDPIIRQAFLEVCELISPAAGPQPQRPLPIDCFWVCADGPVEVWIGMARDRQGNLDRLTIIIATPPSGARPNANASVPEPIWIVRRAGPTFGEVLVRNSMPLPNQPINTVQPKNEPAVPVPVSP